MVLDGDGVEILSEDESLALLAQGSLGRVAATMGALPVILPVRYGTLDGDIVFRAGAGRELRAIDGSIIAFQADSVAGDDSGWHVLVVGPSHEMTARGELDAAARLDLAPWPHPAADRFVRLVPQLITGRRFHFQGAPPG